MTITRDALLGGRLTLDQPAQGYRFNEDSVLLAQFVGEARGTVFDLGAGVGTVGLLVASLAKPRRVVLIERDATLAGLARKNAAQNSLPCLVDVIERDVAKAAREHRGEAHVVVANPPFYRAGRFPRDEARLRARFGELAPFVDAARELLGRRGRACFVYPAAELAVFFAELRRAGLEPKRLRTVHSARTSARIALVEAKAGKPGGLAIEMPTMREDDRARSRTPRER